MLTKFVLIILEINSARASNSTYKLCYCCFNEAVCNLQHSLLHVK